MTLFKLLDDQVRPENCDAVKPLVINTEVHLSKQDCSSEKNMRYVGNAVCGAGKCLAYLMDMFATAEADVRSKDPDADGWLVNDQGVSLDLPKANRLLINMARLLGTANVQTGQARRSMLIHKFKEQFKKLCVRSNHFADGMFFGPDFNAAMALISDATKVQTTAFQQKRKSSDFSRSPKWKKSNSYADFFSISNVAGGSNATSSSSSTATASQSTRPTSYAARGSRRSATGTRFNHSHHKAASTGQLPPAEEGAARATSTGAGLTARKVAGKVPAPNSEYPVPPHSSWGTVEVLSATVGTNYI